jgi:hypothetical protein
MKKLQAKTRTSLMMYAEFIACYEALRQVMWLKIDLRYLVVRESVQKCSINLEHIGIKEMLVDPLMKGLPPHIFRNMLPT